MPRSGLPCAAQMRGLRRRLEGKQLCSPGCQAGCVLCCLSASMWVPSARESAEEQRWRLPFLQYPFLRCFLHDELAFLVDGHVH